MKLSEEQAALQLQEQKEEFTRCSYCDQSQQHLPECPVEPTKTIVSLRAQIAKLRAESETYEQLWEEAIDCIRNIGAFVPEILELGKVKLILEHSKVGGRDEKM